MDQKEYQKLFQQIGESQDEAERINEMSDNEFHDLLDLYGKMLKMDNFQNTHQCFHRMYEIQEDLWLFYNNFTRAEIIGDFMLKFI